LDSTQNSLVNVFPAFEKFDSDLELDAGIHECTKPMPTHAHPKPMSMGGHGHGHRYGPTFFFGAKCSHKTTQNISKRKNLVGETLFTLAMEPKRPPQKVGGCHLAPLRAKEWPACRPPRPWLAKSTPPPVAPHCEVESAVMISCRRPLSSPTNISSRLYIHFTQPGAPSFELHRPFLLQTPKFSSPVDEFRVGTRESRFSTL
jgi:hypothetical protein